MKDLKIIILGDTHIRFNEEILENFLSEIQNSDYLIHTGDYISEEILEKFIEMKDDKFIGVFGNADPLSIRKRLPNEKVFCLNGYTFGVTHPAMGGADDKVESLVYKKFFRKKIQILIFGHTHNPIIERREKILVLNPGKGYIEKSYFGPHTSFIILSLSKNGEIKVELRYINTEMKPKEFYYEKL